MFFYGAFEDRLCGQSKTRFALVTFLSMSIHLGQFSVLAHVFAKPGIRRFANTSQRAVTQCKVEFANGHDGLLNICENEDLEESRT